MISYELAKKLKDAGFPLNPHRRWELSDYAWLPSTEITRQDREKLWIPSLEELIEACGKDFLWLKKDHDTDEWYAEAYGLGVVNLCRTPDAAVARLWLSLNKRA